MPANDRARLRERRSIARAARRVLANLEPWYNWGEVYVERMQEIRLYNGGRVEVGGEGKVRFVELQWFGVHLAFQVGRTPKAVR